MDPTERPTDSLLKQLLQAGEEEDMALPAGSKVGRYVVLERIGGGGMGLVYKAYDPELDRAIALKLMRGSSGDTGDTSARLLREAKALAKVAHPNIVAVHDVGLFGDQVFVAMEYVPGDTLTSWRQAAERTPEEIIEVFRAAGQGLAAAHAAGLVHRDFKPDNVVVGKDGRVRVLDFGLARAADSTAELERLAGTPAYMAPEQHRRQPADARSDQFSFCVALYEALHGQLPFRGDSAEALAAAVTSGRMRAPTADGHAPAWVRPVLHRGLAVDPEARYPSMDELLADLAHRPPGRRLAIAAAVLVGAAGVAAGVWWLGRTPADACGGGETRLAGIWDAQIKTAARASFLASGRAHAPATFDRVSRVLDGQAAEWVAMQRDICESRGGERQPERVLAMREACLDQRLGEMERLTGEMAAADARVVDRAVHSAFELSSVAACADVAALELAQPAAAPPRPETCTPRPGLYFPLDVGRIWVYDVIDKASRRSRGDPKVVTVDGLMPVGGCKGEQKAFRVSQVQREGHAYRWQEAVIVPAGRRRPAGVVTVRHRDQWFDRDGRPTKDEYYVPSRIRLDETCENALLGATYLDAYDQVEVQPGSECGEELARERKTFDWKVNGVDVPIQMELDYRNPACCPPGAAPCKPPPDGPGHRCRPAGTEGRWSCEFRALQVDRREVAGGTAATYWFAAGVGKVLEDEKGEDREELICFSLPR